MTKYIDLVLCKHPSLDRLVPFKAPAFTSLKEGDHVKVERGICGHTGVEVVKSLTIDENSEQMAFILTAIDPAIPLGKVLSKLTFEDIEWEEEKEDE